jgi:DNA polymerase elongation subunit (family B)
MTRTISGWLFDVYPSANGVTLWFIDKNGEKYRCNHKFTPSFFLHLDERDAKRAEVLGLKCPVNVSFKQATRQELFSGDWWNVLQVFVHDPMRFRQAVFHFEKFFPHFAFFNSDILVAQLFLYETQLFALGYGDYIINETGELVGWTLHDSRDEVEYTLPPLTMMMLRNANDFVPPKYQRFLQLEVMYDNKTYTLEQETPIEMLEALNWHLYRYDPDIILTEYGDAVLMPKITQLARQYNVPLLLNRDNTAGYKISKESSFFQYGKVVHKDGAFELRGRWHVDADNSFTIIESDLEGLYELTRVTQLCPQHQARASIGTGLSSLQLSWAYRNNILIPSKKREPEDFKSASLLLLADRGGLIYMPPIGYHEDIAELDFVSMYPAIMVNQNISPETVNCRCCNNSKVPELGYSICEQRSRGIIPATLDSIVRKRAYYKKKKKELRGKPTSMYHVYDRRQNALKWMLVSCFGYLGYKNARFGRIEAHESVNAFSRDAILRAKEIAEAHGYELIHAIIDCMWLKKKDATEQDYQLLCHEIAAGVGIDISLEGIYDWILFPASKMHAGMPTGTRYVGWYHHEEMKIRGIETRRRDTPKFIKNMQAAMLEQMSTVHDVNELGAILPALLETAREHINLLRSGKANPMELVIRRHISKEAEEYSNNSISATVTSMLEESGVHLAAGEAIEFIIIDQTGKQQPHKAKPLSLYAFEDGYDIEKYTELALNAVATLLQPFGYDDDRLMEAFGIRQNVRKALRKKEQKLLEFEFASPNISGR